ncbi:MAG TPA: helix-turn-helix domain-containing protein [Candidatus Saccharimonadales bacterium]|jgi:sugar-specific transcriptional regulator TrmB
MQPDTVAVRAYFAKLGLEPEIADIYLALHSSGPQTISELSRTSKVERTRIYRLIDALLASGLIEVETRYKRSVIKAAPIANLAIHVNQKEQEIRNLRDELGLIEQVLARNSLSSPATHVQFYYGPEGLRQIRWNQLRAKHKAGIGYAHQIYDEIAGTTFMDRWAEEFTARGFTRRLLVDDNFYASWQKRKPGGTRIRGCNYNCIDPASFRIGDNCDVYDDVTVYFQQKDGETFGIEIHNQAIADTQRQFFELLWPMSRPETRF